MISFVRGILEEYTDEGIVVDVNGLGLAIAFPLTHRDRLPSPGEEVKIYTHYQVGEDAQKLYGFSLREERETFRLLIKVSGIGPKLAMSILSAVSLDELRIAVVTGDVKTLSRAPGLGKKTAEKLILELKDKFSAGEVLASASAAGAGPVVVNDVYSEAVAALISLGYSSSEALKAVQGVEGPEDMTVDEVLQAAFSRLALF